MEKLVHGIQPEKGPVLELEIEVTLAYEIITQIPPAERYKETGSAQPRSKCGE